MQKKEMGMANKGVPTGCLGILAKGGLSGEKLNRKPGCKRPSQRGTETIANLLDLAGKIRGGTKERHRAITTGGRYPRTLEKMGRRKILGSGGGKGLSRGGGINGDKYV